jgi:hypothetical protein
MIVTEKPKEIVIKDSKFYGSRSLPWYIMVIYRGTTPYLTLFLGDDICKQHNMEYLKDAAAKEKVIYDWVRYMNYWGHYEWISPTEVITDEVKSNG